MATDPKICEPGDGNHGDGLAKGLLAAVGLVWVFSLAVRAFRTERVAPVGLEEPLAGRPEAIRFGRRTRWELEPLPHPVRAHETRDASAKWIFGIVGFLIVFGISLHFILAGFLSALKRMPPPTDQWRPMQANSRSIQLTPPFPRLQVSPPMELKAFRQQEETELDTYGWIDKRAGVVRIPIGRAMDLVLKEGLPTRTSTNASQVGPSTYQLMQQRPDQPHQEITP